MADKRRAGFTLLEMMIVLAVVSVAVALLYTPMVNGLIMVNRENTLMNMFRTGDITMSRLASLLQPAVLPIPTKDPEAINSKNSGVKPYRDIINSNRGFKAFGKDWRDIMLAGTDFLPFCVPTMYRDTESAVDVNGLPVLGVTMPDGERVISATYRETINADGQKQFDLNNTNIHPALANLNPTFYGLITPLPDPIEIHHNRYRERLSFPATSNRGFGVIRFVPNRVNDEPEILEEADLEFDLNQNGTQTDVFARGRLVVTYAGSTSDSSPAGMRSAQTEFPLGNQSILLQLNTDAADYIPMFRLVGGFTKENSPAGTKWNETTPQSGDTYILLVRLLLFDYTTQQGTVMATGSTRKDGRQFITRQFQSFIEMRNMSLE